MSTQNNHTYLIHVVHSAHSNNIELGDCTIIQSGRHQQSLQQVITCETFSSFATILLSWSTISLSSVCDSGVLMVVLVSVC